MPRLLAVLLPLVLAAACAEPSGIDVGSPSEPAHPPSCEELEGDPPGEQVHAGSPGDPGDRVLAALQQWAETEQAGAFAGMWLDQDADGRLTVAFSQDAEALGDEVHERFSEDIAVVAVEHSAAELTAVQQALTEEMGEADGPGSIVSTGQRLQHNRVSVDIVGGDDDVVDELAERHGADRICLTILDPPQPMDLDGPVRPLAKVEGWRDDLAQDLAHPFALVEIAYDQKSATQAWADNVPGGLQRADSDSGGLGLYGDLDDVDFDDEALVVWSSGESGSCPGWLEDIDTGEDGTVHLRGGQAGAGPCTGDYNPYRMLLAVDRGRLPDVADLPTTDVVHVPDGRISAYPDGGGAAED